MHLCILINPTYHPTSISHLQCHPPFIYPVQKLTNGAPTLHQSILVPPEGQAILHWGTRFCTYTFNRISFYSFGNCKNHVYISSSTVDFFHRTRWRFSLAHCNPCYPWLGHLTSLTPSASHLYPSQNFTTIDLCVTYRSIF
jgi:hypothetical protein